MASRINTTGAVGSLPAVTNMTTSSKYFDNGSAATNDGTPLDASWFNMVQEEICSAATARNGSLSTSNNAQVQSVLQEANALRSKGSDSSILGLNASSIGGYYATQASLASLNATVQNGHGVVIGSDSSSSTGTRAGCYSDMSSTCSNTGSVAIGSNTCVVSGLQASALSATTSTVSGNGASVISSQSSTASGNGAHVAGGSFNTASGAAAAVLASTYSTASGNQAAVIASAGASGAILPTAGGNASCVIGSSKAKAASANTLLVSSLNCELATTYSFALGYDAGASITYNGTNQNNTFRVQGTTGTVYADGTVGAGNADFAEMFPVAGNGPLPAGRLLTGVGRAVRVATVGEPIRGVVSAAPCVLGNAAPLAWSGKFERNEFGAPVMETVTDSSGVEVTVPKVATGYDPSVVYVPRAERPDQWCAVALTGQVRVAVAADIAPGAMLAAHANGLGIATTKPKGRPVEVLEMVVPFDAAKGYGVALCLVG